MNEENQVIHRDIILPIPSDPALKVDVSTTYRLYRFVHTLSVVVVVFNVRSVFFTYTKVGRIKCPLLLVNAGDDQNWASVESAEDVRTYY